MLSTSAHLPLPLLSQDRGGGNGAFPIDTSVCRLSKFSIRRGLHVVELFAGIKLGVLRIALAVGHNSRRYAYCDRDPVSRLIAKEVLQKLQQEFPGQLPAFAIASFHVHLPDTIEDASKPSHLQNYLKRLGSVDLLGASWECQSVSQVGYQQGIHDPRSSTTWWR